MDIEITTSGNHGKPLTFTLLKKVIDKLNKIKDDESIGAIRVNEEGYLELKKIATPFNFPYPYGIPIHLDKNQKEKFKIYKRKERKEK